MIRALGAASFEPTAPARRFAAVVDALYVADDELLRGRPPARAHRRLPSRGAIADLVDDLRGVLFPAHPGDADLEGDDLRAALDKRIDRAQLALVAQVRRGLSLACAHGGDEDGHPCASCDRRAGEVRDLLIDRLPAIRDLLMSDVQAAFEGDPAARFVDETLLCYPGVAAIIHHRIAHDLFVLSVPLVPRTIAELARAATDIDIRPGAKIGPRFFVDHVP
jgi:serine O-acetyltransferase